ncbi:Trypsin-1 [Triplophysa tibetana]|uniref:trypsin n=1 Tax=Triplophysa tibetana TaxID=1572043 RepID=A0A5A9NRV0_9TELE|nr:Trypsin-1 [Triplophysa tibetana]
MRFLVFLGLLSAASAEPFRIVNGYECKLHSQPWQVLLKTDTHLCGGSLINDIWVVSAAHCYSSEIEVRLGEHDIVTDEGTEQSIRSERVIAHPRYDRATFDNDIMLLKLSKPAVLNEYVKPLNLPKSCVAPGTKCNVSGWGRMNQSVDSDKLQCLETPILSDRDCDNSYPNFITDSMFCSGFLEGGKDSCQGDSGGPLVCDDELQGIISAGGGCAAENQPGIYTKVCVFNTWLTDTMSRN